MKYKVEKAVANLIYSKDVAVGWEPCAGWDVVGYTRSGTRILVGRHSKNETALIACRNLQRKRDNAKI